MNEFPLPPQKTPVHLYQSSLKAYQNILGRFENQQYSKLRKQTFSGVKKGCGYEGSSYGVCDSGQSIGSGGTV